MSTPTITSNMINKTLEKRIVKASKIFPATVDTDQRGKCSIIQDTLDRMGIDDSDEGLKILNASSTIYEDFYQAVKPYATGSHEGETARFRAAWAILKGNDPFKK